jgi:hypothetical protein
MPGDYEILFQEQMEERQRLVILPLPDDPDHVQSQGPIHLDGATDLLGKQLKSFLPPGC